LKLDALGVCRWTDAVQRGIDDRSELHELHIQADLAGHDAAHVEQIRDQLRLMLRVALVPFRSGQKGLRRVALEEPRGAYRLQGDACTPLLVCCRLSASRSDR
jgi:hypothetical protein